MYSVHPFPFAPFAQSLWTVIPYLVAWSERNRLQAAGSWTVVTDGHELSGEHKFIINPLLIDSSTSGKISTFRLGCIQPFQAQLAKIISNSSLRFSYVLSVWNMKEHILPAFELLELERRVPQYFSLCCLFAVSLHTVSASFAWRSTDHAFRYKTRY